MDNNVAEKDPWNNLNMAPGGNTGEVSQEGLEREAEWNAVMADAPEFGANSELSINTPASELSNQESQSISTESEPESEPTLETNTDKISEPSIPA